MSCQKCKEARNALKRAASSAVKGDISQAAHQVRNAATLSLAKLKESERVRKIMSRR